jgi:hypothetical protein
VTGRQGSAADGLFIRTIANAINAAFPKHAKIAAAPFAYGHLVTGAPAWPATEQVKQICQMSGQAAASMNEHDVGSTVLSNIATTSLRFAPVDLRGRASSATSDHFDGA